MAPKIHLAENWNFQEFQTPISGLPVIWLVWNFYSLFDLLICTCVQNFDRIKQTVQLLGPVKVWTLRSRPGNPAHFSKKLSKETYLYFHRSIQIAENLVKKSLFWPTFWKSGSKKSCFSGFSGNPADGFFPKSNQLNFKRKHAFVPNLVMIRHFVRKLSCLQTTLPPPKK